MSTNASHPIPPSDRIADQGPMLIGVTCMLLVLSSAAVGGRYISRRLTGINFAADDYLVFGAYVLLIGYCIEQVLCAHYGVGKPPDQVTPHDHVVIAKLSLSILFTYLTLMAVAKLSVLALYRRIFSLRTMWFRIGWWMNAIFVVAYFFAIAIRLSLGCLPRPMSAMWDLHHQCRLTASLESMMVAFVNAVIDLTVLLLPIRMVWALHLPRKQKLGVCCVFLLGFIGVGVSCARARSLGRSQMFFTHDGIVTMTWSVVEPSVAVICACLPMLRPLFTIMLQKQKSILESGKSFLTGSKRRGWKSTHSDDTQSACPGSAIPFPEIISDEKAKPNIAAKALRVTEHEV